MKSIIAPLFACFAATAFAQSTAMTYQGRLSENGGPANGTYELRFILRNGATTNDTQVGPTLFVAPLVVNGGVFSVPLDFGSGVFTGAARWLEVGVRTNGGASNYSVLLPLQRITATPYAMQALAASNLLGSVSDSQLPGNLLRLNGNQTLTGNLSFSNLFGAPFAIGNTNTNKVVWLNADLLDGLDSAAFARSNHAHSALDVMSGTLADLRLSPNVALLTKLQTFSSSNTFTGVLTATNGSNLFRGNFTGNGAGLTGLNAATLSGLIPNASLPASVAQLASNQTFTGTAVFSPVTGAPFRVGNAALVTNLNADLLDGVGASAFWNVGGNAGTSNANFIGTTDNQPLEFRVNGSRALRIVPTVSAANIVAGALNNSAGANVLGAVIGGGSGNTVTGNFAVVIGGQNNSATNQAASVLGGVGNIAGGQYSVAAGRSARATHDGAFVWADGSSATAFTSAAPNTVVFRAIGGVGIGTNAPATALHVAGTLQSDSLKVTAGAAAGAMLVSDANGNATWQQPAVRAQTNLNSPNLIGGHLANTIAGGVVGATIGGGGSPAASNYIIGNYGTIAGGAGNRVTGGAGTVGGGTNNSATINAVVAGGLLNSASDNAAIGGGSLNSASGFGSFIGGGTLNAASGVESAVAGGFTNRAGGLRSFVGGGDNNRVTNSFGTIGGGIANTNHGFAATIAGGQNNAATNLAAMIPGGSGNVAGGQYSLAAGRNARALHNGSFVWADSSTTAAFSSTADNQFMIRAAGGIGIGGVPFDAALDVEGDARINDFDLFLRSNNDRNHGIGWYGPVPFKAFSGLTPDGPVLYGWAGGGLGTKSTGERMALSWNTFGVGIGTQTPGSSLEVNGGIRARGGAPGGFGANNNGYAFSGNGGDNDSGMFSSANGQLEFYVNNNERMRIMPSGNVGIGTTNPIGLMDIATSGGAIQFRNDLVPGINIATSGGLAGIMRFRRAMEIWPDDGLTQAGYLDIRDATGSPRITLRGAGDASIYGNLDFGSQVRQMLNLWGTAYGIGVQSGTIYFRTDGSFGGSAFAWYKGGVHNDGQFNAGGGNELMRLDSSGLYVNGVLASSSDRNLKTNIAPVNPREILERVLGLHISTWSYTNDDSRARHIGPMAQDFFVAFQVGADNRHIASVDADGVALAAIQGINELLNEKAMRISELEKRIALLERQSAAERAATAQWQARLEAMERLVSAPARRLEDKNTDLSLGSRAN
jgi:trimeric autotransporter adhesin